MSNDVVAAQRDVITFATQILFEPKQCLHDDDSFQTLQFFAASLDDASLKRIFTAEFMAEIVESPSALVRLRLHKLEEHTARKARFERQLNELQLELQ